ncbi:uncharacterized protein F4817DRAFT_347627 [Daldinia loculata]|uniref:uncharacterized protein n=1 Tax=Daldinia loculata TaxID=103429 RepID=UPI0020C385B5|nr:uncharacterized protein F4817DRAFT_347627 [Daldinia loculata]KAI1644087.1 hypothetical protein F4817DRAFT_347627 [Daldinia loculata]
MFFVFALAAWPGQKTSPAFIFFWQISTMHSVDFSLGLGAIGAVDFDCFLVIAILVVAVNVVMKVQIAWYTGITF